MENEILFENVSFSYDGKEVFRNLNVRIPSDRHVALVGVFLACVKMIDMVSGLSGDFSEEYVECGEEVQKLGYLKKLEGLQHGE